MVNTYVVTHYHPSFKVGRGSNQARQSLHGLTSIFLWPVYLETQ